MAGEQRPTGLGARSAAGPRPAGGAAVRGAVPSAVPPPVRRAAAPAPSSGPSSRPSSRPSSVAVPESRVAYLSIADAARRTGASLSAVRGWARDGQVRSRTGSGPRGDRTEVALIDVERLTAERPAAPARPPVRGPRRGPEPAEPAGQLVPLATVEAMERLSGELYLAGQRAARAEAVAELRDRRLADLQQEVDDLQREATGLWEQNQELLRRVAVAEAQVLALQQGAAAPGRGWLRR